MVATPEQYGVLYPLVASNIAPATEDDLVQLVAKLPVEEPGSGERVPHGQKRASAAVTLLRLGEREKVLPVFAVMDDPEALTQFIFRCRERDVRVEELLECLRLVIDGPVDRYPRNSRYALLLALGEYVLDDIPEPQQELLLTQLGDLYRNDPSSGVHGAAGWLLRKWGHAEIVRKVDQTAIPYSADREWFTLAITVTPQSPQVEVSADENAATQAETEAGTAVEGTVPQDEEPRKNDESGNTESAKGEAEPEPPAAPLPPRTFYYTFIVFPPGQSMIGSVDDETGRQKEEIRRQVTLTQSFALLDREITFEELMAFGPKYEDFMQQSEAKPEDAGFGAHWYEAVGFCRWLSQQSGLSESDQSYADPESLDQEQFPREPKPEINWAPRDWPLEFGRRGFRLPTDSEWEVACRAGVRTGYGYGSDAALLKRFGWFAENSGGQVHSPREKCPGFRGLFDMHGNLFEWTHDWYGDYEDAALVDPVKQKKGSGRVLRGGSWSSVAAGCRSADRVTSDPTSRTSNYGFRLALSCPSGPSLESEQDK